MNKNFKWAIIVFSCFFILSCNEDNDDEIVDNNELQTGDFRINFRNTVNGEQISLSDKEYTKNGGETFSVNELKYIISNIRFNNAQGNSFVIPQDESYFLINEENITSKQVLLDSVSTNTYTSITFGIGIDQTKYPLNGVDNFVPQAEEANMLWSWSAGYIFVRLEGFYSAENVENENFKYHIGSHGQNLDNYKEITLEFEEPILLSEDTVNDIIVEFDLLKVFDADFSMLLSEKDDIQVDPENAPKIAQNTTNAFRILTE